MTTAPLAGIVTGGVRGIGRHLTLALAKSGARCIVNYVRDEGAREALEAELRAANLEAQFVKADVSTPDGARALIDASIDKLGRLDFLLNNAGISRDAFLESTTDDDWSAVVATNLSGPFYTMRAAIPHLTVTKGSILNISSRAAFTGFFGTASYSASKAGLNALTKSAARELGKYGIRVNAISPPFVPEGIVRDHPKRDRLERRAKEESVLGVHTSPRDLADFVLYLLAEGRQVSGQVFKIDSRFY